MKALPPWLDGVHHAPPDCAEWVDARVYNADTGEELIGVVEIEFRSGRVVQIIDPFPKAWDADDEEWPTIERHRRLKVVHYGDEYLSEDYRA